MKAVVGVGAVPPGPSGVTDYGRLLSEELRRRGAEVEERWIVNGGLRMRDAGGAAVELLRLARAVPRGSIVLWHYSSFAYTLRGIPLPGVLFGLVLRKRRVTVVTLLHEPAYGFGRRRWKGLLQALTQQLALPLVLGGSDVVVVTTSRRARALRHLPPPLRRPVHCVPVFSTLGDGQAGRPVTAGSRPSGPPVLGVPSWTSDGVQPQVLIEALRVLPGPLSPRVLLLGSGESTSDEGGRWLALAEQAGLGGRVGFTGVVSEGELSAHLSACDLVVFLNVEGPSSRKTTLAAALAHGMPIVALDGRARWPDLVHDGAVEVVPARPPALAAVIGRLLADDRQRNELGARARSFYESHMRLADVAGALETILSGATAHRAGAYDGAARRASNSSHNALVVSAICSWLNSDRTRSKE